MPQPVWVKGFSQTVVSRMDYQLMALTIGRIGQAGADIIDGKVVKISHDLFRRHAGSQIFQHVINSHAGAPNTGLAAPFAGFQGNDVLIVHVVSPLGEDDLHGICSVQAVKCKWPFTPPGFPCGRLKGTLPLNYVRPCADSTASCKPIA